MFPFQSRLFLVAEREGDEGSVNAPRFWKHAYCSGRGRGLLRAFTPHDWSGRLLKWGVSEQTSNSFIVENFMKLYKKNCFLSVFWERDWN